MEKENPMESMLKQGWGKFVKPHPDIDLISPEDDLDSLWNNGSW
ncbi:hypothetical protein [Silicibacter phage DSS3phi2]|uniref:Uncharacterized protein n=1 Tax=Silicibacter phage DSS3phi2 TaxID=490912 RepID=C4NT23_9CAUD|nr:hypothetical protein DSS3P2_gp21 [Silicibacter phage DSS3phi2]ACL81289.1 hypothetical protein [Silicibacter phage DSS3phi2]